MTSHFNQPAFPTPPAIIHGMTLRDYFAAKAMQAMISMGANSEEYDEDAHQAYAVADAMLKARDGQD